MNKFGVLRNNNDSICDKCEFPMTDSLTSYSCPRKRNLEVLESH